MRDLYVEIINCNFLVTMKHCTATTVKA